MSHKQSKKPSNVDRLKYLKRGMLYRRKWVSNEKWWNPLAWGDGYYVEKGGDHEN